MARLAWFYHHKDIEKQINLDLLGGTIGIVLYALLGYFDHPASFIVRAILFFHIVYIFAEAILLTKRWVDRTYR